MGKTAKWIVIVPIILTFLALLFGGDGIYGILKEVFKTYGDQHSDVAKDWNNLGTASRELGDYKKAVEYYEKALASDLKTYGDQHPQVATVWNNLGAAWQALGQYPKAIEYYEKALASDLKTYGDQHPEVAVYSTNLHHSIQSICIT